MSLYYGKHVPFENEKEGDKAKTKTKREMEREKITQKIYDTIRHM